MAWVVTCASPRNTWALGNDVVGHACFSQGYLDFVVTCQVIFPRSTTFLRPTVLHLLGSKTGNRPRLGRTVSQALKARQALGDIL